MGTPLAVGISLAVGELAVGQLATIPDIALPGLGAAQAQLCRQQCLRCLLAMGASPMAAYPHVCVCIRMYTYLCTDRYTYMYVFMSTYTYGYAIRMYLRTHMYTYMYLCAQRRAYTT